jgi:xanthosine utilization system XapX-like protein
MEPAVADCDKVMLVGFVYVAVQVPEVAPPVDVQLMFV